MKDIIWENSNTDRICEESWMYIKKKIVNLDEIEDDKSMVNVIIDGKRYKFKNAGNQRLSGMYRVAHLFNHLEQFSYSFDEKKHAIIIDLLLPNTTGKIEANLEAKSRSALVIDTNSALIQEFDAICQPVVRHIEDNLKDVIKKEVQRYHIFTEADLQTYVHNCLVQITKHDPKWLIKCNVKMYDLKAPDIILYYNYDMKIIIELKFHVRDSGPYFPAKLLQDDRKKILEYKYKRRKSFNSVIKGYLIAVYDAPA